MTTKSTHEVVIYLACSANVIFLSFLAFQLPSPRPCLANRAPHRVTTHHNTSHPIHTARSYSIVSFLACPHHTPHRPKPPDLSNHLCSLTGEEISEKLFTYRSVQIFKILFRRFYSPESDPPHKIMRYWFYYSI